MPFEWQSFLQQHNIPHAFGAPHSSGNVGVTCPFCGSAGSDPSRFRMGIHLDGRGWRCLRDETHRGRSPVRLVAAMLNVTHAEALRITGLNGKATTFSDETFNERLAEIMSPGKTLPIADEPLTFPPTISTSKGNRIIAQLITTYLTGRGYTSAEAKTLATDYGLRAAIEGPFGYRIVFPVEMPQGLATWTGRAISNRMVPKYKTLSPDADKARTSKLPRAHLPIGQCLWNARELENARGKLLIIVEGPFDALRIDYYGRAAGIRATCLFGKNLSDDQALLAMSLGRFEKRKLALDRDAVLDMFRNISRAEYAGLEWLDIKGVKDPAMLSREQVLALE